MLHVYVTWLYCLHWINVKSYYESGDRRLLGKCGEAWMRKAVEKWPEGIVYVKIFKKLSKTLHWHKYNHSMKKGM